MVRAAAHDEWYTPKPLFKALCKAHDFAPETDYAALDNRLCPYWVDDALHAEWKTDGWLNPPHSKMAEFLPYAWRQWDRHNISLLMLVPWAVLARRYTYPIWANRAHRCVRITPLYNRPAFLPYGRPIKEQARQEYCSIFLERRVPQDQPYSSCVGRGNRPNLQNHLL